MSVKYIYLCPSLKPENHVNRFVSSDQFSFLRIILHNLSASRRTIRKSWDTAWCKASTSPVCKFRGISPRLYCILGCRRSQALEMRVESGYVLCKLHGNVCTRNYLLYGLLTGKQLITNQETNTTATNRRTYLKQD